MFTVHWMLPNGSLREAPDGPYTTLEEAKAGATELGYVGKLEVVATVVVDAEGAVVFSTADDHSPENPR